MADQKAVFGNENQLRLVIKEHEFELKLSNEILRSSSCKGYAVEVTSNAQATFYDSNGNLIAKNNGVDGSFAQVEVAWSQDKLSLNFGRVTTIDNYPNCDGEYDRYSEKWVTEHTVTLNFSDNSINA